MFKYAVQHNGIDALAYYDMDIGSDPRKVANPARAEARKQVKAAEAELIAAERALPQLLQAGQSPKQKNAALPGAHQRIRRAQIELETAKAALKPIPAKAQADPGQDHRHRAGPRGPTRLPAPGPPRPAKGPATAGLQRRSLARRAPQCLPG